MSNIRHEIALWAQGIAFIGIWLLLLWLTDAPTLVSREALAKIPDVVLVYGLLHLVFTRWAWRLRMFQGWLVPFPDLQGTWTGTLQTTWKDADGRTPDPLPLKLVIRQSFSSINCMMLTAESSSRSTAASIHLDDDAGTRRLSYVYSNIPRVGIRDRSALHHGAVEASVAHGSILHIRGEYWTSRKSTGEFSVAFRDRSLDETFD